MEDPKGTHFHCLQLFGQRSSCLQHHHYAPAVMTCPQCVCITQCCTDCDKAALGTLHVYIAQKAPAKSVPVFACVPLTWILCGGRSLVSARKHLHRSCVPRLGQKRLEPTWRLAPGECRDSLALEVAANCRLPKDILQRASEHYQVSALPASELTLPGQDPIKSRELLTFVTTALSPFFRPSGSARRALRRSCIHQTQPGLKFY